MSHYGACALLLRGLATLLERGSRGRVRLVPYHFVAQPVVTASTLSAARTGTVNVALVDSDDPIVACFPRPKSVIDRRFRDGAACFVARKAHEFAGFLWLQTREYNEDEVRCLYLLEPPDSAAWDFDVYVEPAYRFGKTFVLLWNAAHAHLRHEGFRWTMSRISVFNRASMRAHERLGAVRLCSALFVAGKRWQVSVFSAVPFLHVGKAGNVPRLRLRAPDR